MVKRAGFTIVEVIVALTLLSIGLLAVASSAGSAALLLRRSELQEEAAFVAAQVLDSLAVTADPASGVQTRGAFQLEWTVTRELRTLTISLTVRAPGERTARQFTLTTLRP